MEDVAPDDKIEPAQPAQKITEILRSAFASANEVDRAAIVDAVQEGLGELGLAVYDVQEFVEPRGKVTGRTRQEIIAHVPPGKRRKGGVPPVRLGRPATREGVIFGAETKHRRAKRIAKQTGRTAISPMFLPPDPPSRKRGSEED